MCRGIPWYSPFSDHGSPWIDGLMSFSNLFYGQWEHPDLSIFAIFSCFEIWLHQRMLDGKLLRTWVRQLITMERVSSIAMVLGCLGTSPRFEGRIWRMYHDDHEGRLVAPWPKDLDLIFDTIRGKTKSVAVVLTPHVLKRTQSDRVGQSFCMAWVCLGQHLQPSRLKSTIVGNPYWLQFQPTWRAFLFFLGDVTWPFDGREMITPCLTRCWPVENLLPPTHPPEGTRFVCFDGRGISKTAPLGCGVLVRLWQPTRIKSWRSHWCVMATPLRMTNFWSTLKRFGRRSKGKSCRSMASAWKMCSKPMFLGNGSASIWLIWYWCNLRINFGTIRYVSRAWLHCVQLCIYVYIYICVYTYLCTHTHTQKDIDSLSTAHFWIPKFAPYWKRF